MTNGIHVQYVHKLSVKNRINTDPKLRFIAPQFATQNMYLLQYNFQETWKIK